MRGAIIQLLEARPFRSFAIVLDSGHYVIIEHNENVVAGIDGSEHLFFAISKGTYLTGQWAKISCVAKRDRGEPLPWLDGE